MSGKWLVAAGWMAVYGVVLATTDHRPGPVNAVAGLIVPPLLVVALAQIGWAVRRVRWSTSDPAARLLSAAVAALPARRREWGMAMLAELSSVRGRSQRWRFALSCARATLALPPAGGSPVLGAVTVATLVAVAAVGRVTTPGLTVFATTFTGLVGALAMLAVARSRRPRLPAPAPTAVVILAVGAAIAATAWFLRQARGGHLPPTAAVALAVGLAGCLAVALAAGPAAGRLAPHLGVAAGAVFAAWFVVSNRLDGAAPPAPLVALLGLALVAAPMAAFFVPAFVAGRSARSWRPGLRAAVWTVAAAVPLTYTLWLPEAVRRHAMDGRTLDGELTAPLFSNLTDALVFCLAIFPVFGLALGLAGAALGARRARLP